MSVAPGDERVQDLAGALHEVSNALTVVLGWLDVARSKLPSGPEKEALEVARTHARLGYSIARQAIGAEVPDASTGQGHSAARAVARAAITAVSPEANRRGVELVLEASDAHSFMGQAPVALQILTNLLFNAIAFTPRGCRVTLALDERNGDLVFTVRDEGPGIAPERAHSLFDGPVSTRRGGAGVGLKHSYALATLHGGRLSVRSTSPGACFELCWPSVEARSSTGPQHAALANVRGARVLVIEDDAAVRSLIELALEARGATTVLVSTSAELELALIRGRYDAALVDLSPIADRAPAVLQRIREDNPGVAVILISGLASSVPDGLEREVAAWVRKPFEMGEVIEVMARLLAAREWDTESAAG